MVTERPRYSEIKKFAVFIWEHIGIIGNIKTGRSGKTKNKKQRYYSQDAIRRRFIAKLNPDPTKMISHV